MSVNISYGQKEETYKVSFYFKRVEKSRKAARKKEEKGILVEETGKEKFLHGILWTNKSTRDPHHISNQPYLPDKTLKNSTFFSLV